MPAGFTEMQQEKIREELFLVGIKLIKEYGIQKTTVDKLTRSCGIAKGSFYLFYSSKEEYLYALMQYVNEKTEGMIQRKLAGRTQMTAKEFFELFREYLFSDYDLMNSIGTDDFLWMKQHMKEYHLFDPSRQKDQLKQWLTLICDVRPDVDYGTVVNLMKSIYAMWKFRETFVQASFENSVQMILKTLEAYVTGSELSLL